MALGNSHGRTVTQSMGMTLLFLGVLIVGGGLGWQLMKPSDEPQVVAGAQGAISLAEQKVIYAEFRARVRISEPITLQAEAFEAIVVAHHMRSAGQLMVVIKEGDRQQWAGPTSGPAMDAQQLLSLAMVVSQRMKK